MSERFRPYSAVFPIVIVDRKILLHRRQNTGYQDGRWDICGSGHVEENETAREATVRELREEVGLDCEVKDLEFALLSHRISADRTYYDIYFAVKRFSGEPQNMEPRNISELGWFDLDNLPEDMIGVRRVDVELYLSGVKYDEKKLK